MTLNITLLERLRTYWENILTHFEDGTKKESLKQLLLLLDSDYTTFRNLPQKERKLKILKKFATVEFLQKNNLTILIHKLHLCKNNSLTVQLLVILDQELIGKGKVLSPFWNNQCKVISKKLLSHIETDYVDSLSNLSNGCLTNMESNSWFSIKKIKILPKMNLQKISYLSSIYSHVEKMEKEDIVVKTKKIRIYPNSEQTKIFVKWMGTARFMYNKSLNFVQTNKIYPNYYNIRNKLVPSNTIQQNEQWLLDIPKDIRAEAVHEMCIAYSTNIKKSSKTHKKFDMKFKSKKYSQSSMTITKENFKNGKIYPKILGENNCILNSAEPIKFNKVTKVYNIKQKIKDRKTKKTTEIIVKKTVEKELINGDCMIVRNKVGKWYICIPEKVKCNTENQGMRIGVHDPGCRTFQTIYSPNGVCFKIGTNAVKQIRNFCLGIDKMISLRSTLTGKKKYRLKIAIDRKRLKIKNRIIDMHNKTIKLLMDNFDIIIIPQFDSGKMTNKIYRNINSKTARNLLSLNHGEFRQRLVNKINEYKYKYIIICSEEYTSQTCGKCGKRNLKLGGNKTFKCPFCEFKMDRDINGARNILLKTEVELASDSSLH